MQKKTPKLKTNEHRACLEEKITVPPMKESLASVFRLAQQSRLRRRFCLIPAGFL